MAIPEPDESKAREMLGKIFGKDNPKFDAQFAELLAAVDAQKASEEKKAEDLDFPGKGEPALFSNQFYVLIGAGWSRLSLGEQVYNELPTFHASFTIPTGTIKNMAETILRIIAEQEPTWEAAAKSPEAEKK